MPVEDHAVSEMVKLPANHRAWCHSKPRIPKKVLVQDGYKISKADGNDLLMLPVFRYIDNAMSPNCRQIDPLPECEGCTAEKDNEYIEKMRGLK